jgi:hypothetical protein
MRRSILLEMASKLRLEIQSVALRWRQKIRKKQRKRIVCFALSGLFPNILAHLEVVKNWLCGAVWLDVVGPLPTIAESPQQRGRLLSSLGASFWCRPELQGHAGALRMSFGCGAAPLQSAGWLSRCVTFCENFVL